MRNRLFRQGRRGFSLTELLIVIAIILIIVAAALPKLAKARMYAEETGAIKAVSVIHTAQTQYYSQFGRYAATLAELGPPTSGNAGANAADLLEGQIAAGAKGGYTFNMQATPTGYAITALPKQFGTSGSRTFFSDQSQIIRYRAANEPATASDPEIGTTEKADAQKK